LRGAADMAVTQVKFSIDSDIVAPFKARCASGGVSMASEIARFMQARKPRGEAKPSCLTRPLRRKAVAGIIDALNAILSAEEDYRDSIPEQFAQRLDVSEHSCDQLSEAISLLEDAFQ